VRVAVVSDIHANLTALEAVLADLEIVSPDLVVQGGDLVVGGARAAEVVDVVRGQNWPGVYGNTDEMLWAPERLAEMVPGPQFKRMRDGLLTQVIPATRDELGAARIEWLRTLPKHWSQDDLIVMHASPDSVWRSPGANASDDELQATYGSLGYRYVVYGHIHHPFVRPLPSCTVVNSGCLTMSYDGDPRASYVVVDGSRVEIRRVVYDMEEEIRRLFEMRYPDAEWVAQMMRTARPLPPPLDAS
jgi:putative phosphoesterase